MDEVYKTISACRFCGSKELEPILNIGDQYAVNFVDDDTKEQPRSPLELVLCDKNKGGCGLLQLKHTFSQSVMYKQYWYRSGVNKTMTDELRSIAEKAESLIDLASGDFVIDIGSNDSTLLRSYTKQGIKRVGFEPAKNLMPYAEPGVNKVINDFFNYKNWQDNFGEAKAKIITAIAMFYDLEDPNSFVADVAKCLDGEGVFIVQQNYLPYMLERNVIDNVSHEHLSYYSLTTFKNVLERHGFEIFDVELNDVNGGSMRTYARRKGAGKTIKSPAEGIKRVENILLDEEKKGLNDKKTYEDFAARANTIKENLYDFIKKEVSAGKKVYVYGASTRGNSLLQFCGLDHSLITAAAERNSDKWNKKTVGTLIPIISEEQARNENPDYFLILPWQFLKEFILREADFLKKGGKFIVPLPQFKVIDASYLQ